MHDGSTFRYVRDTEITPPPLAPVERRQRLERRRYRRHRLEDAARLLPLLGALLIFGPIVILASDASTAGATSSWLVYFLGLWLGLIGLTALLVWALNQQAPQTIPANVKILSHEGDFEPAPAAGPSHAAPARAAALSAATPSLTQSGILTRPDSTLDDPSESPARDT